LEVLKSRSLKGEFVVLVAREEDGVAGAEKRLDELAGI
jgi:hypothetical protein